MLSAIKYRIPVETSASASSKEPLSKMSSQGKQDPSTETLKKVLAIAVPTLTVLGGIALVYAYSKYFPASTMQTPINSGSDTSSSGLGGTPTVTPESGDSSLGLSLNENLGSDITPTFTPTVSPTVNSGLGGTPTVNPESGDSLNAGAINVTRAVSSTLGLHTNVAQGLIDSKDSPGTSSIVVGNSYYRNFICTPDSEPCEPSEVPEDQDSISADTKVNNLPGSADTILEKLNDNMNLVGLTNLQVTRSLGTRSDSIMLYTPSLHKQSPYDSISKGSDSLPENFRTVSAHKKIRQSGSINEIIHVPSAIAVSVMGFLAIVPFLLRGRR